MGDVLEFLVDGTSGLAPGDVSGSGIIAGVCSLGEVGRGYLLGKSSDLTGLLGVGPLVDRLRDLFAAGGQNPVVIAVPVAGQSGGYFSDISQTGLGPVATVAGVASENSDIVVRIGTGGALGTATYQLSTDGGTTFGADTVTPVDGQIGVGGITIILGSDSDQVAADEYACIVRAPIGPVRHIGSGPDIILAGTVAAAGEIRLNITGAGGRNEGRYQLSVDGGDSWDVERTIPVDGLILAGSTGATITVPDAEMEIGDIYECRLLPPVPSISSVLTALETPLSLYDVEFVHVTGPSDSVDWAAMGAKADELWNRHRPTFFIAESRLPQDGESLDEWVADLIEERQGFAHRFVAVCTAHGEVSDTTGKRVVRNWAGLLTGRILSTPVMRAIGRVRDGGISQGSLPGDYSEAHQAVLEKEGFVTARHYAGMRSAYWGDGKTLAELTSDYQYLEPLRTIFKGIRLMRIQALKSLYDEAGDPLHEGGAAGLAYLTANLENALNSMVGAVPQELAGHNIVIPPRQDIVKNGVAVEAALIGIPIIRQIKLFANYTYAGSAFDPRLKEG
ncbi:MAG: DUF2586 family protein [Magnetococcales bacterium]|nr:DUF2586 family protein [Magnetococcales bacterium]